MAADGQYNARPGARQAAAASASANGANSQALQLAAQYPQAVALMAQNSSAFSQLAHQPAAVASFAKNAEAFSVLGRQPAFHALINNAAFSAAARSQSFADAVNRY